MSTPGLVLESAPPRASWRPRLGVTLIFFMVGTQFANWVPRIPEVRAKMGASESDLGLALLALAVGALIGLTAAGKLADRFGIRRPLLVATVLYPVTFAVLGLAPSLVTLGVALFAFGFATGLLDVSMNLEGAVVEREAKKAMFSSFHGAFSLGGVVGALTGALAAETGLPIPVHFALAGAVALVLGLIGFAQLAPLPPHQREPDDGTRGKLDPLTVAILGLIAFCALVGEGVITDWSAILVVEWRDARAWEAGAVFAAFSAAMTIGRFSGDMVIAKMGRRPVVGIGAALAAVGYAVATVVDHSAAAIAGFGLAGVGLSCMFPALLAAAVATYPRRAGAAVAAVSTLGYFGFLIGPVAIGFGAEAFTLPLALAGVGVLLAAAAFGSFLMPRPAKA